MGGPTLLSGVSEPQYPPYQGRQRLQHPETNARRIKAVLEGPAYGMRDSVILVGEPQEDSGELEATRGNLLEKAEAFGVLVSQQELAWKSSPAFFMLDGHGELDTKTGAFVFCTHDTRVCFHDVLRSIQKGIKQHRIDKRKSLEETRKACVLPVVLVLSTCHSAAAITVAIDTVETLRDETAHQGDDALPALKHLGIITSTTTNAKAYEDSNTDPFTSALLVGLEGAATMSVPGQSQRYVTPASLLTFLELFFNKSGQVRKGQKICHSFVDLAEIAKSVLLGTFENDELSGIKEAMKILNVSKAKFDSEMSSKGADDLQNLRFDKKEMRGISYTLLTRAIENLPEKPRRELVQSLDVPYQNDHANVVEHLQSTNKLTKASVEPFIFLLEKLELASYNVFQLAMEYQLAFCGHVSSLGAPKPQSSREQLELEEASSSSAAPQDAIPPAALLTAAAAAVPREDASGLRSSKRPRTASAASDDNALALARKWAVSRDGGCLKLGQKLKPHRLSARGFEPEDREALSLLEKIAGKHEDSFTQDVMDHIDDIAEAAKNVLQPLLQEQEINPDSLTCRPLLSGCVDHLLPVRPEAHADVVFVVEAKPSFRRSGNLLCFKGNDLTPGSVSEAVADFGQALIDSLGTRLSNHDSFGFKLELPSGRQLDLFLVLRDYLNAWHFAKHDGGLVRAPKDAEESNIKKLFEYDKRACRLAEFLQAKLDLTPRAAGCCVLDYYLKHNGKGDLSMLTMTRELCAHLVLKSVDSADAKALSLLHDLDVIDDAGFVAFLKGELEA
eukprot:m.99420 g.99420  ORF g.99420 m.99420 type:complete len:788 (+) comp8889_c0_seq1:64-2427(+)